MRYFLDTEYNGFGGELISLALVPETGDQEFYATLALPDIVHNWVAENVVPFLHMVPQGLRQTMNRIELGQEIARYLAHDRAPMIVADWPDDIGYFCTLLTPGPGDIVDVETISFLLLRTPGFSTAANSAVPHNALHDARALRDFVLEEDSFAPY
ncbi:hypothetical protein BH10PSE12_BH10PSE12_20080 [soil metagenome]